MIDAVEKKLGKKFKIRHCANTGAVARYPETWLDMVRPGLLSMDMEILHRAWT